MNDESTPKKTKEFQGRTNSTLGLNIKEAKEGKSWLLLPEGFRDRASGKTYPLPSFRADIQVLVTIPIPPGVRDAGTIYLRRALEKWRKMESRRCSAVTDVGIRTEKIKRFSNNFEYMVNSEKKKIKKAVNEVYIEADKASASLKELFSLGRRGLRSQMEAHLAGKKWMGEKISSQAFRQCYAMVAQTVKGLGIPSEQKVSAEETIIEQVASAIKDTQEAVLLAPGTDPDVEH